MRVRLWLVTRISAVCVLGMIVLSACAPSPLSPPEIEPEAQPAPDLFRAYVAKAPAAEAGFLQTLNRLYVTDASVLASTLRSDALDARARSLSNPFRPDIAVTGNTIGDGNLRLQATQPLIEFGKRSAEIARLNAARGLAEQEAVAQRSALLATLFVALEDARHAKARIALHRRQIAEYKEAARAAEDLVGLNLASSTELRLAEVEAQRAQVDLTRAQQDLADARLSWSSLLGSTPIPNRVDARVLRRLAGIAALDTAQDIAEVNAPSIRKLQASRSVQTAEVELTMRQRYPTVSATAVLALDGNTDTSGVGLSLDVPLLKRDLTEELAEARAEIAAIDTELTVARRNVRSEIARAEARAASYQQLAAQEDESVTLLRMRIADITFQVNNGLVPYTDVIEARVDMFETELAALQSRAVARVAQFEILLLSGVLVP